MPSLKLSELMPALSHALAITEGQPEGHCVRCCWIGMHIGQQVGLSNDALWTLYYTLLLKDPGCSSNAARICEIYVTDDLQFKRDFKWVDGSLAQALAQTRCSVARCRQTGCQQQHSGQTRQARRCRAESGAEARQLHRGHSGPGAHF